MQQRYPYNQTELLITAFKLKITFTQSLQVQFIPVVSLGLNHELDHAASLCAVCCSVKRPD